ncbi:MULTISPECIES: hypothetical protein [Staphylococcus]|uniref:GIY-YIG domain-containing protein n=1 Tax=Staphylococcus hsinchuensis TaxID=3051183 RepID=A0ABZ3EEU8_9STAP|nr:MULTISPECIES: hypothetical protein [unclassified Staphylococcus]
MNGDKQVSTLLDEYKKPLKKLFKYDKSKALKFDKESRSEVVNQKGIYVIFKNKSPLFVGQAGGYMTGYKLTQKDLNDKLAQYNLKSTAGTAKFKRTYVQDQKLDESEVNNIKAEEQNLRFQYIKVKNNPAMINLLEVLALEYAKDNKIDLYNFS